MKDLNEYVEELLYKHQCVIIPKFGAFISNRKSARLFEDKTFAPPKRELTFNASLHSNDGLLIKHISENSGVEYNVVEDYVNLTVDGWKKILQQGETLNLNNIGVLRQTPEGRLSFEVFEDVNYLTDSFGMSAFVPHEIAEVPEPKPEAKIIPTLDLQTEQETKTEKPFVARPKVEEPKRNKKRPIVAYTTIAVVGLVLLTFGAFKFFGESVSTPDKANEIVITDSQIQEQVEQKLSRATLVPPMDFPTISLDAQKVKELSKTKAEKQANTAEKTVETPVKEVKKEETKKEVSTPKQTVVQKEVKKETVPSKAVSTSKSKKYQVIAGAFKDEKNAHTRVEQLKKLGFKDAAVIGTNSRGLYQVSYAGFDDLAQAEALKKEVKETKDEKKLDGGWILTNE
ncbi:SPOR domain-containing protein [Capnocytophaga sp.]|uniref:HU domain-containing protein n=1 Tax=Capnocytophaga sp. TaxID=44737 RepID=UPI0026DDB5B2|nr:SPOR domain-containing protein [Capnocytophaga sp.]MDO5104585.1 SPOR domain-containing protein [Capnocytophaga sp.]